MTEVLWNEVGERTYEAGVDHAVLYPEELFPGVPWNGLVSVKDKTTGGETTAYYFDGEKFFQVRASTEFSATIEAFTYPIEFEKCDGTKTVKPGILVTDQDRSSFGLCYRTKVGNDVEGIDYGYKLHLIYNALVAPSEKDYVTIGETLDPNNFTWDISTTPIPIPGFKVSAHLIIDSRRCSPVVISALEDILYGRTGDAPRLPLPAEIFALGGIVDPVISRFVTFIATPETALPGGLLDGDAVVSLSDLELYYLDSTTPIEGLRDIMVLGPGEDIPGTAVPGDLIYDSVTNDLFQVGA